MKRILSFVLAVLLTLPVVCPVALAEESRPVLTIGDVTNRSSKRVDGEDQLGLWKHLEDKLGIEIQYVYLTPDAYASGLASGNLPDIVATDNNLSAILDGGVALDVEPYLEELCPNFLNGDAGLTYGVYEQLLNDGEGFYSFPARIGYNNVGFSAGSAFRGYIVRWDYYKELGYPPVNNETITSTCSSRCTRIIRLPRKATQPTCTAQRVRAAMRQPSGLSSVLTFGLPTSIRTHHYVVLQAE